MTGQANRGKITTVQDFLAIKRLLKVRNVQGVSAELGLSETTIRRVNKSKTFSEYKGFIAASNGSKQFNENEFEKSLNKIQQKPRHESMHHYQNQPYIEESKEVPLWLIILICVALILAMAAIGGIVFAITQQWR